MTALGEVRALGARRAADPGDGRLGRVHVPVDDSRVQVATPPWYRPRGARVTVLLEQVVAGGAELELELELIQAHITQKPVLRVQVGACRIEQQTSKANN